MPIESETGTGRLLRKHRSLPVDVRARREDVLDDVAQCGRNALHVLLRLHGIKSRARWVLVRDPLRWEVVPCRTGVLPVPIPPSSVVNVATGGSLALGFCREQTRTAVIGRSSARKYRPDDAADSRWSATPQAGTLPSESVGVTLRQVVQHYSLSAPAVLLRHSDAQSVRRGRCPTIRTQIHPYGLTPLGVRQATGSPGPLGCGQQREHHRPEGEPP
jgi:hypothetical protein